MSTSSLTWHSSWLKYHYQWYKIWPNGKKQEKICKKQQYITAIIQDVVHMWKNGPSKQPSGTILLSHLCLLKLWLLAIVHTFNNIDKLKRTLLALNTSMWRQPCQISLQSWTTKTCRFQKSKCGARSPYVEQLRNKNPVQSHINGTPAHPNCGKYLSKWMFSVLLLDRHTTITVKLLSL